MKRFQLKRLLHLALFAGLSQSLISATYYVDSVDGSDRNKGLSEASAWASLKKANKVKLKPGDSILLKRGATFNGSIKISEHGSAEAPITISS